VLFIDLDNFKSINDSLGHAAGDDVLQQTARRLRECVRESDTVARIGERRVHDHPAADPVGARSGSRRGTGPQGRWRHPSRLAGNEHFLNASIGIALYPADGTSADMLLRNADTAMYRAKEGGRGCYVYFEERMNIAARARVNLERELRRAIDNGEFRLCYQPKLDLRSGRISGAEALTALAQPRSGRARADGIHSAGRGNRIDRADRRMVLREACRQYAAGGARASSCRMSR
jgi:predicted signal transduction protein with EAL and GGDEF domain